MKLFLSVLLLLLSQVCTAANYSRADNTIHPIEYDISDVAAEVAFLRPLGFLGSIAGTAVFIGTMPLSLFASIAPPHDVIDKAAKTLIVGPANATFQRPFAFYHYNPVGKYPRVVNY